MIIILVVACAPSSNWPPPSRIGTVPNAPVARTELIPKETANEDIARGIREIWAGTAHGPNDVAGIKIEYLREGRNIQGRFCLGKVGDVDYGYLDRGKIEGTIVDGIVQAVVVNASGCVYELFGFATDEQFVVNVESKACTRDEFTKWELLPG